MIALWKLISY